MTMKKISSKRTIFITKRNYRIRRVSEYSKYSNSIWMFVRNHSTAKTLENCFAGGCISPTVILCMLQKHRY